MSILAQQIDVYYLCIFRFYGAKEMYWVNFCAAENILCLRRKIVEFFFMNVGLI